MSRAFGQIGFGRPDPPRWPPAGRRVGGLDVALGPVPNTGSIATSLFEYELLPRICAVPFAAFGSPDWKKVFYDPKDDDRSRRLADKIRENGWIAPLIVVVDKEGPYILEGIHRFAALLMLGVEEFPALVVLDTTRAVKG